MPGAGRSVVKRLTPCCWKRHWPLAPRCSRWWTVKALEGGAGAWRCELRGADAGASLSLHSPVAIAAHGSWESLPSERPHRRGQRSGADLLAFKANFRGAALQEGLLPVLCFDGGYGGMVVADGGVTGPCGRPLAMGRGCRRVPWTPAFA